MEPNLEEVTAERDRLRDELDAVRPQYEAHVRMLTVAVEELTAERDRLRQDVEAEKHINGASGCPDCGVHDGCFKVVAERDRLRAVVDALRRHRPLDSRLWDPRLSDDEAAAAAEAQADSWGRVLSALDALDGSEAADG